ncbi:MAG TPA: hypothetical protein VGC59_02555 [Solirubrobacteraceae bacterium]
MAARSLWNGTIVFGAVTVPIKLHAAVESRTVHFHEVHLADGTTTSSVPARRPGTPPAPCAARGEGALTAGD